MDIGSKIWDRREDMDFPQREMAKLIPMNQSNYSKIERNIQEPSMEQLRRICEILNLDPRYLLDLGNAEFLSPADRKLLADIKKLIREHPLATNYNKRSPFSKRASFFVFSPHPPPCPRQAVFQYKGATNPIL